MKLYYKNLRNLIPALGALFLLASCSSYQYTGYENDGIYSSSSTGEAYTADDYEESYEDALYYQNLFGEKAAEFEAVPQEGAIFTDVESYSSGQYDENMFGAEGLEYEPGRAAWGSDPDVIAVNVYNNYSPFYSPYGFGYGYPYYAGFYDPFYGPGYYPYRYYNPYYGYGYPYAYNSWRWNIGLGFGWGHYYGHRYSPYYPYGYKYYPNYRRSNVAYSNSRRDGYSDNYRARQYSENNRTSRIQSYSNSRNVRAAGTVLRDTDGRTYRTRSTRVRSTTSQPRTREVYRTSTRRSEVPAVRRSAPQRNTAPQTRTSRSSRSNNSGTYRSSSSNTRSSGTSSGSSRSSRGGRGN